MSTTPQRVVWFSCVAAVCAACQPLPLPSLPAPGPVSTAGQAISIAINHCVPANPKAWDVRDASLWKAKLEGDSWVATYTNYPRQYEIVTKVSAQTGAASPCTEYLVVT